VIIFINRVAKEAISQLPVMNLILLTDETLLYTLKPSSAAIK